MKKWNEMTPKEQAELRRRLDKAGIPRLQNKGNLRVDYTYHITMDKYYEILEEQGWKCAICEELLLKEGMFIDHDHLNKKVRGILCRRCNTFVGIIENAPNSLYSRAIKYLRGKSNAKNRKV